MANLELSFLDFKEVDSSFLHIYLKGDGILSHQGYVFMKPNLGDIIFDRINILESLISGEGTNILVKNDVHVNGKIEINGMLESGGEIKTGGSIRAHKIAAKGKIEAGCDIKSETCISGGSYIISGGNIESSSYIKAIGDVESGGYIRSDGDIISGGHIKCGLSLISGFSINCESYLRVENRIYAGASTWADIILDKNKIISCEKLEKGEIICGLLRENL